MTVDGDYILLSIQNGCDPVNRLWYLDLKKHGEISKGPLPWIKLIDNFDAEYSVQKIAF